jgi:hypothetical protein
VEPTPSDARLTLRLLIGMVDLGADRLEAILRAASGRPPRPDDAGPPPAGWRQALIGALLSLPGWRGAVRRSAPARLTRQAAAAVGRTRAGRAAAARATAVVDRVASQLHRLALLGQDEERRGRALAEETLTAIYDLACARLAESEAIRTLVRDQSTSLTESAITGLQDRTRAADEAVDNVVDRAFARLLRRRRRPAPPVPAGAGP